MPCLKIFTNLTRDKIPENFVLKIVPLLAKLLRKPENSFTIMVSCESLMSFRGETTKCSGAVATLESIGNLGLQENKAIIKEVTSFLNKELGIAPENFLLSFYDLSAQNIGRGGDTVA